MATPFRPQPGSPLLQLPGELRNKILKNIFKQEDQILLVPYIGPPTGASSPVMICAVPDIAVFTICRQFHGEAKSSFLENNTFMLSTQVDAFADASTLGLLSRWMDSLGLYRDYVRKVVIDLSPLCPRQCYSGQLRWIDLKPIMMAIWKYQVILTSTGNRQRSNIDVSFGVSGRQLLNHSHHFCNPPRPSIINGPNLNAMITLLTPQRSPEMSAYLHSDRSLREIQTSLNGLRSVFVLASTHDQDASDIPMIEYNMKSSGQLEKKHYNINDDYINDDRCTGIERLLQATSICKRLLGMLVESNEHHYLTYNIESRTISRRLPELFSINGRFRELALRQWQRVHVVGNMTSRSAQATFSDFASIQAWCAAIQLFFDRASRDIPPTLKMRFELPEREDFSCLRIPITNIVMATLELPTNSKLWVEQSNGGLPLQYKTGMLYRLRRQTFVFLADILYLYPELSNEACPEVLMDGNCIIKEAEYKRDDGNKYSIKYERAGMSPEQIEEEMDYHIAHLVEQNDLDMATYVSTTTCSHAECLYEYPNETCGYSMYDFSTPLHPSLRGVTIRLGCFLQEAGSTEGYWG